MTKNIDRKKKKTVERRASSKRNENLEKLSGIYPKLKTYGLAIVVLIAAYYGYIIRAKSAKLKYFIDPDTFFHYEMFRQAVKQGAPSYFPLANPPTGIEVGGTSGIYVIPAKVYSWIFSHLGYSELHFFKIWTPLVGAITVIGIYLLGRKLHSDWAGFWAALFLAFSYANYTKTYSGNARGEAPFLMFFVFAVLSMAYYLDIKVDYKNLFRERKGLLKILWGALFVVFSWFFMMSWGGSQFGIGVILLFMAFHSIVLFTFGKIEELRRFTVEFYSLVFIVLLGALYLASVPLISYKPFIVFSFEVYVSLLILNLIMLFGNRIGLNYSDKKHRLGTVIAIGVLGFIGAYFYYGPDLKKFMGGAYQSNPLYQTVAELAKTGWGDVKNAFSIHYSYGVGQDGLLYIFSVVGFAILLMRMLWKYYKGDVTSYKEAFLAVYYGAATYLLWTAVRFTFQASGAVILLAGVFLGEVTIMVERMEENLSTKAMFAIVLALLLIPVPIIAARDMSSIANSYSSREAVTKSWQDTLLWMRNNTNPLDSATSWWDYGYWIESSLLSHRRSSTDGGHAYDRRYILAKFFSHSGNKGEVDFEAWELNYLIAWLSDVYKFNAISYLGGAITYGEYGSMPMFMPVGSNYNSRILYDNKTGQYLVRVTYPNGQVATYAPEFVVTGSALWNNRRNFSNTIPYTLYIFSPNYGVLAYNKIAFSNFVQLAFGVIDPGHITDSLKLRANFRLVKSTGDLNTYMFTPFGVYRIDALTNGTPSNGTWTQIYTSFMNEGKLELKRGNTTVPLLGDQTFKLYISAFGRDIKDATLVFEAYNGTKLVSRQVLKRNLNINHLNETPVIVNVNVPKAEKYRFVLIQQGPVGVLDGPVKVNGREVNPSFPIKPGQSGDLSLTAAFRKDYSNVTLALRAMVTYYLTPNGNDIYRDDFYLDPHQEIVTYIPVREGLSVKAGDNEITGHASVPENVFSGFIDQLKKKYGNNVVVYSKRLEPVFLTQKEYVIWESG